MSIHEVLFDYEGLGEKVHKKFLGKTNTELGKQVGISKVQAAKVRNGLPVGATTLFKVAVTLNLSLDKHLVKKTS